MRCPYCNFGETKVIETRETEDSDEQRTPVINIVMSLVFLSGTFC